MIRPCQYALAFLAAPLLLAGCGDGAGSSGGGDAANTHVEEMGPMGGGTTTVQDDNATAPVGEVDNGNVTPGNIAPNRPR